MLERTRWIHLVRFGFMLLSLNIISTSCKNPQNQKEKNISESNVSLVSDSIIYDVVNYIIESQFNNFQKKYSKCKYLMDKEDRPKLWTDDSIRLTELDTLFTKNDLKFIFKQNNWAGNFKINKNLLITNIKIISKDTLEELSGRNPQIFWDKFYSKFGKYGITSIGLPLFSIDKKTVIITFSERYGVVSGQRSTIILKKINSNWKNIYLLRYKYS